MNKFSSLTLIALLLSFVATATAQDAKPKQRKRAQRPWAINQLMQSLSKTDITEEQKTKVKEVVAKHQENLVSLQKRRNELLGQEVIQKMNAARKSAMAEGKKGRELQKVVAEAAGLDSEKTEKLAAINKEVQKASNAMKKAVREILTDEQIEKAGLQVRARGKGAKGKGKKGKRKGNADADK